MKTLFRICLTVVLGLLVNASIGQVAHLSFQKVNKIDSFENLYHSGNYYFAGQPSLETFNFLKEQGVKTVINLRSDEENQNFTKEAFNEELIVKEMGMKYVSIPMAGKAAFSPKTLAKFSNAMEINSGKVVIHCKAAGRVTLVMMAYLMKQYNYTLQQAEAFGKQITYFNYIDALLGEN